MPIAFRSAATATSGATPSNTITIAKPAGVANGDCLVADIAVQIVAGVILPTPPPGWGLVAFDQDPSGQFRLFRYGRCGKAADPAAGWTWILDSARNWVGVIRAYRDTTANTTCRICSIALQRTSSATTHESPIHVSNVANQWIAVAYAAAQQDTWTQDAAITERSDDTTSSGTADLCLSTGDLALAGTGSIAAYTAILDSGNPAEGVTLVSVITSMGMHQPAGTGGGITIHDNVKMANATDWNLEELRTSYPGDLRLAGVQGSMTCYELDSSVGSGAIFIGQASSPQTTTWRDRNVRIAMNNRSMATSASNLSFWEFDLGTKIGVGEETGAMDGVHISCNSPLISLFRGGLLNLYGLRIFTTGALTIGPGVAGGSSDIVDLDIEHAAPSGTLTLGSATFPIDNLEGVNLHRTAVGGTADAIASVFATNARRFRVVGTGIRSYFSSNVANAFDLRDVVTIGDPDDAVIRWGGSSANGWKFTQWRHYGTGDKFSVVSSGNPTLANATLDRIIFQVKLHDLSGMALAGISVKLTDLFGNVLVDETTDANGNISFGADNGLNAIVAADWYAVGTTPTIRHRSPYRLEINNGPVNGLYQSFDWPILAPGYESVTPTSGFFEDLYIAVALGPPVVASAPIPVSGLPMEADGTIRILGTAPAYA